MPLQRLTQLNKSNMTYTVVYELETKAVCMVVPNTGDAIGYGPHCSEFSGTLDDILQIAERIGIDPAQIHNDLNPGAVQN